MVSKHRMRFGNPTWRVWIEMVAVGWIGESSLPARRLKIDCHISATLNRIYGVLEDTSCM